MPISEKTRKLLWGRSGNRCAMCRGLLAVDSTEADPDSIVGDECHIISGQQKGPRHDKKFLTRHTDEYENLILLCKVHHKQVDDQTETYTVDMLTLLKANHEKWVAEKLDKSEIKPLRLRRIKENIPPALVRIGSGKELLNIVEGTYAISPNNDSPENREEMELLSGFFQEMQDWSNILGDEAGNRVRAEFRFTEMLNELDVAGFWVFGGREVQMMEGGIAPGPQRFPILILNILRSTNPKIRTIDLRQSESQPSKKS